MRQISKDELSAILAKHLKWRRGEDGGERANLTGADLTGANLTDAYLTGAYLTDANLTGADLTRAYLTGADLTGANLTRTNLADAYLTRANLTDAYLTDAYLTGANLTGANLTRADLTDAYLTRTNLTRADLTDASAGPSILPNLLRKTREDFMSIIDARPHEVAGLRLALVEGRIDGSTYSGPCSCLVGTLANLAKVEYCDLPGVHANASRAAEVFFTAIRPGHLPTFSAHAAWAVEWIDEWLAMTSQTPNRDSCGDTEVPSA